MSSEEITFQEFGENLKKARTEQSRTLDDLASYTKIHRRHLEAIESGDISQLPQGPYAKAFLREYARALGVKVPEVLASPAAPSHSTHNSNRQSHSTTSSAKERSTEEVSDREEGTLPIGAVAKETARFANTAVKSAVKTVTKTTESMVNLVETGGKEALEALTSRSLWEEAEEVRRERLGFAPRDAGPGTRGPESEKLIPPVSNFSPSTPEPELLSPEPKPRTSVSSKGATNVVIALLLLLFAGAAFFAIRMYKRENGNPSFASKDYIPAPLEKPQPLTPPTHEKQVVQPSAPVSPVISPNDSLQFTLRATQPVWVSIAPDGIPAYRGELKAGDTKSYKAGEKFVVNIGNQKSVDMRFNGQRLSNLPTIQNSGVVVRDLVLMRDHITLSGTAVDVKKLTTAAPAPTPVTVLKMPAHVMTPPQTATIKRPFIVPLLNHGNAKNGTVPSKGTHPAQKNVQKPLKAIGNKSGSKPSKAKTKPHSNQPSGNEIHTVDPIPPRP